MIPQSVSFVGTIRTFTEDTYATVQRRFREIVEGTCSSFGVGCEIEMHVNTPPLVNAEAQADAVARAASRVFGKENVRADGLPIMASEDFAEFTKRVPGAFWFLTIGDSSKGPIPTNHNPKFDFTDSPISNGIKTWVRLIEDRFNVVLYF